MKVVIEDYNPSWPSVFNDIKGDIAKQLSPLNPIIEHIGSTSIKNLKAKPVIDILVGLKNSDELDSSVLPLIQRDYIYYEKYNPLMPYRRFFVKLKSKPENISIPRIYRESDEVPNELNDYKLAHLHVLEFNSQHWIRHIAFRDYIREHESIREKYELLKLSLSQKNWKDGNEYNAAKNDFIKDIESMAVEWYQTKMK